MVVSIVIAGVVVAVATVPANPLVETTETVVTVPEPPPPELPPETPGPTTSPPTGIY